MMWWIVGCLVILVPVVGCWGFKKGRKSVSNALKDVETTLSELSHFAQLRENAMVEVQSKLFKAEALAKVHISKNEQFEQQARDAWARYHAAGLAAGNAQAWLLRELQNSVHMVNVYRRRAGEMEIKINPQMVAAIDNFKQEHVKE